VYRFFIPIPVKMKYAAPGLLVLIWAISIAPMAFGGEQIPIGNTAHLGGLVVGLIYGFYLKKKYPNKIKRISKIFS
jgi:membrane associated rhomboid family serine protease